MDLPFSLGLPTADQDGWAQGELVCAFTSYHWLVLPSAQSHRKLAQTPVTGQAGTLGWKYAPRTHSTFALATLNQSNRCQKTLARDL